MRGKFGHRHAQREDNGKPHRKEMTTSQGNAWKGQGRILPSSLEEIWLSRHLDFGLLASRTARDLISAV